MSPEREDGIQGAIVEALRWSGYEVLVTSRRRHRCSHCGCYATTGDGCDRGVPDLLVSLGGSRWLALEVKGPTTRLSPEQQRLHADGRISIVRSVDEAFDAVHSDVSRVVPEPIETPG